MDSGSDKVTKPRQSLLWRGPSTLRTRWKLHPCIIRLVAVTNRINLINPLLGASPNWSVGHPETAQPVGCWALQWNCLRWTGRFSSVSIIASACVAVGSCFSCGARDGHLTSSRTTSPSGIKGLLFLLLESGSINSRLLQGPLLVIIIQSTGSQSAAYDQQSTLKVDHSLSWMLCGFKKKPELVRSKPHLSRCKDRPEPVGCDLAT